MNQRTAIEQQVTLKEMEQQLLQILIETINNPEAIIAATKGPENIRRINPDKTTPAATLADLEAAFNNKVFTQNGEINIEVLDDNAKQSLLQQRLPLGVVTRLQANNAQFTLNSRVSSQGMSKLFGIDKADADKLSLREILVLNAVLFTVSLQVRRQRNIEVHDAASMKMLNLALSNIMSQVKGVGHKQRGKGFEVSDEMKASLNQIQEKYASARQVEQPLDQLLKKLLELQTQYKEKDRSRHKNDIQKLVDNALQTMQSNKPTRIKYDQILFLIEQAFIKEMHKYQHPFLGAQRSNAEFVERVTTKKDYQYPNMLANLLQNEYTQHPHMMTGRMVNLNKSTLETIQDIKNVTAGEKPAAEKPARSGKSSN